jgi:hypothetical protein
MRLADGALAAPLTAGDTTGFGQIELIDEPAFRV